MAGGEEFSLKREIGWFGSFAMGYADVGPTVFVALGVVALYAGGAAPLAFVLAATVYLSIGMAYAELAPTYPYAGGVQVYALRASNSLVAFLAGWALILDYTLWTSLAAVTAAGYMKFLIPGVATLGFSIPLLGIQVHGIGVIGALLIAFLIVLNYFGIRYSAGFNSILVFFVLAFVVTILVLGFSLAFDFGRFMSQINVFGNNATFPEVGYLTLVSTETNNFLYGLTLAMASFIGIESIAQAAEETKKPHRWIPRAAKLSIVTVLATVLPFAALSIGTLDWRELGSSYENPVAKVVSNYPVLGSTLAPFVAFASLVLLFASSNTGVIGVSRLVSSMSKFNLLARWFHKIHPVYRTPHRTIVVFGAVGLALALPGDIPFIASLYNFGALVSYMLLMYSLLLLRNKDPEVYRPWKSPLSLTIRLKGRTIDLPMAGIVGIVGTSIIWSLVVLLHPTVRLFGFLWIAGGLGIYVASRTLMALRIVSVEEREMVVPKAFKMDLGVLVRPLEEEESVMSAVTHNLDQRFRLLLVTVLEPPKILLDPESFSDVKQIDELRNKTRQDLERIASALRSHHYSVDTRVYVGDIREVVTRELAAGRIDTFALIRRRTEKADIEKAPEDSLRMLIKMHPGEVMVLRRAD